MNMNDDELKTRFRELRREDAKTTPSFEKLTRVRPRRWSPLVVLAPALAAAAGLLLWCGVASVTTSSAPVAVAPARPPPPSPQGQVASSRRHAGAPAALPLDFLLETTPIHVRFDADPTEGLRP